MPNTSQDGTLPLGGEPPAGATTSVKNFDYQIKYQRAFEAVLWNMPAVAIYGFRRAAFDNLGLKDNDIIAYSGTATPLLEAITANSTTPYITAFTDLRKGPVVLEVPVASAEGSVYGQVVDAWQFTIADVGPSGLDGGKGGKLLFTPPRATPRKFRAVTFRSLRRISALRWRFAPSLRPARAWRMPIGTRSNCGCTISPRPPILPNSGSSTRSTTAIRRFPSTMSATLRIRTLS
jgi:hypothetical protein